MADVESYHTVIKTLEELSQKCKARSHMIHHMIYHMRCYDTQCDLAL